MGQVMVVPAQETQPFQVGAAAARPVVEMMDLARPRRRVAALVTAVPVTVDHGAGLGGRDAAGEPADVQRHRVRVRQQPHDTGVAGQATSRIAPQVGARVEARRPAGPSRQRVEPDGDHHRRPALAPRRHVGVVEEVAADRDESPRPALGPRQLPEPQLVRGGVDGDLDPLGPLRVERRLHPGARRGRREPERHRRLLRRRRCSANGRPRHLSTAGRRRRAPTAPQSRRRVRARRLGWTARRRALDDGHRATAAPAPAPQLDRRSARHASHDTASRTVCRNASRSRPRQEPQPRRVQSASSSTPPSRHAASSNARASPADEISCRVVATIHAIIASSHRAGIATVHRGEPAAHAPTLAGAALSSDRVASPLRRRVADVATPRATCHASTIGAHGWLVPPLRWMPPTRQRAVPRSRRAGAQRDQPWRLRHRLTAVPTTPPGSTQDIISNQYADGAHRREARRRRAGRPSSATSPARHRPSGGIDVDGTWVVSRSRRSTALPISTPTGPVSVTPR